jgi:hypothetical protein
MSNQTAVAQSISVGTCNQLSLEVGPHWLANPAQPQSAVRSNLDRRGFGGTHRVLHRLHQILSIEHQLLHRFFIFLSTVHWLTIRTNHDLRAEHRRFDGRQNLQLRRDRRYSFAHLQQCLSHLDVGALTGKLYSESRHFL